MSSAFLVCCLIITGAHLILADNEEKRGSAQAPTIRKLGKHDSGPSPSPSTHEGVKNEESAVAEQEEELEKHHGHHHHHHRADKSIAGGGVIIGGLVTIFLAAIFCYLRATRRRTVVEPTGSPTNTPRREKESVECGHSRGIQNLLPLSLLCLRPAAALLESGSNESGLGLFFYASSEALRECVWVGACRSPLSQLRLGHRLSALGP
ncbi:Unknown protein [Striga hermonthica]|uniref:Uncharacterized protein n=1 Tax=Striga hermonthica TaxID=68872 RepID=A0A9N7NH16_STRHE|nr:Unknown protein [Striga hermonthica]